MPTPTPSGFYDAIDDCFAKFQIERLFLGLHSEGGDLINNDEIIDGEPASEIIAKRLLQFDPSAPSKKSKAKLRKAHSDYANAIGKSYSGAGKIIAFAYIDATPPIEWFKRLKPNAVLDDRDAVLLGYDADNGVLSIIALKKSDQTLLSQVVKCFALSQAVDSKKLLSDLKLPRETAIAAAVLADRSAEIDLEINRPHISALTQKLSVTIALK
jgi:hypothetical protein